MSERDITATYTSDATTTYQRSKHTPSAMPPLWTKRDGQANLFSPTRRKIEELIERNARRRDMTIYEELGNMLAIEDDLDVLSSRLDRLDMGFIPPMTAIFNESLEDLAKSALHSLMEITVILQALSDPRRFRSEEVQRYLIRCYPLLVDRWTSVTAWWMHTLLHFRASTRFVVRTCVVHLHTVLLASSKAGEYQEELATRKSTLDLVYALICQADSEARTTPYNYFYLDCGDPQTPCLLIELFVLDFGSPVRSMAMVERLQTMKSRTRHTVVKALIERVEQICQLAIDNNGPRIVGYINTLAYVLRYMNWLLASPLLRATLERFDCLRRITTSLQTIVILAHKIGCTENRLLTDRLSAMMLQLVDWATLSQSIPSSSLLDVLTAEGHILKIAELLPCDTTVSITSFLWIAAKILPYLHSSEIFHAANISGLATSFKRVIEGLSVSAEMDSALHYVPSHYPRCFRYFEETYTTRQDRNVHLCHNITHRIPTNQSGDDSISPSRTYMAIRTCGRCHSVAYCSVKCQREDWVTHAPECSSLASQHRVEKRLHYWVSSRLKQNYLRILDTVANIELPPPSHLNRGTAASTPYDLRVNLVRFFIDTASMQQETRLTVQELLDDRLAGSAMRLRHGRIENYVHNVLKNLDTIALVCGLFAVNHERMVVVFAQMDYRAEAPEGYRYSVLSSFFSIVDRTQIGTDM